MKRLWALALICCATAVVAFAQEQEPASTDGSPPDTIATAPAGTAPPPTPDTTAVSQSSPAPSETPVNVPPDTRAAPPEGGSAGEGTSTPRPALQRRVHAKCRWMLKGSMFACDVARRSITSVISSASVR